jgi:hypothetical protein
MTSQDQTKLPPLPEGGGAYELKDGAWVRVPEPQDGPQDDPPEAAAEDLPPEAPAKSASRKAKE